MNMSKTLNDLQPGDKVICEGRYHKDIYVVERVTKNYVIVKGHKFRKTDGNSTGSDFWSRDWITPLTPELEYQYQQEIKQQQLCAQVKRIAFESLTVNQLQAILDISENK